MKLVMGDFRARFKIKRADHNRLMDIETEQIYEFKFHKLQQLTQEIVTSWQLTLHTTKFMTANMIEWYAVATK